MNENMDRLYELLPAIYRQRDAERDYPLRDFLRVVAGQVDIVEADIDQLYENWFIETCQDWVVPYIGDLVGFQAAHPASDSGESSTASTSERVRFQIPRRDVADTIRNRRRKGTLALLEELAADVSGWPARAVEFYKRLEWLQALQHLQLAYGRSIDLRRVEELDRLAGPFDDLAHVVDVRRINSRQTRGRHNIPSIALFVWRLGVYPLTHAPAYCQEAEGDHCFTFSILGNDAPLYTLPVPERRPTDFAGELNLPLPIRRRALAANLQAYYGPGRSFQIWEGAPLQLVPSEQIEVANLTGWHSRPLPGKKAVVDPELGRIVFDEDKPPENGVWVTYHYGFSAEMGGGEYERPFILPPGAKLYRVGAQEQISDLNQAFSLWQSDNPDEAVIEIVDNNDYLIFPHEMGRSNKPNRGGHIRLRQNQRLTVRSANHKRPLLRLLDWRTNQPDALRVQVDEGSHITLDGVLISGRGLHISCCKAEQVSHQTDPCQGEFVIVPTAKVTINHSTLVPGWTLDADCEPEQPAEPSLILFNVPVEVRIDHAIIGSIQVNQDEVQAEPIPIHITDSILDATDPALEAIGAPGWPLAHAILDVMRSTVIGMVQTHAIRLAEDSIFMGQIKVGRRQLGCMRFCYVSPGSQTPKRYNCQPDLVERPIWNEYQHGMITENKREERLTNERARVKPEFNSVRYGTPAYCQLAFGCAGEIKEGASDQSEMGAFHDLYQPQRETNLQIRLDEYVPADMDAGIIFAS